MTSYVTGGGAPGDRRGRDGEGADTIPSGANGLHGRRSCGRNEPPEDRIAQHAPSRSGCTLPRPPAPVSARSRPSARPSGSSKGARRSAGRAGFSVPRSRVVHAALEEGAEGGGRVFRDGTLCRAPAPGPAPTSPTGRSCFLRSAPSLTAPWPLSRIACRSGRLFCPAEQGCPRCAGGRSGRWRASFRDMSRARPGPNPAQPTGRSCFLRSRSG